MHVKRTITILATLATITRGLDVPSGDPGVISPPNEKHSNNTMIVFDPTAEVEYRRNPYYLSPAADGNCHEVRQNKQGKLNNGLRPTDDIWCTLFARADCNRGEGVINVVEDPIFAHFTGVGIETWDDPRNDWSKSGRKWWPRSFICYMKYEEQVGLSNADPGVEQGAGPNSR
jgi:hypothetical protein